MVWSKRNSIQLAVAVAVGMTAILCIGVAIGLWKTNHKQSVATSAASLDDVPTGIPTNWPTRLPVIEQMRTIPPSPSPTLSPSSSPSNLPSRTPSQIVTPDPSNTPTRAPTKPPTKAPTMPLTASPTKTSTRVDQSNAGTIEFTTFYGIADAPYDQTEARELPIQVRTLPTDAEFLVHLGDIRSARTSRPCRLYEYTNVAATLRQSPVPVFMVLGDNEWNDCPNINTAMGHWHNTFGRFEDHWAHSFQVTRPENRTECFTFFHKKTLFIGLNLVGGRVHSSDEWKRRLSWQVQWTTSIILQHTQAHAVVIFGHANPTVDHSAFFTPLTSFIQNTLQNRIPIMYMNGDSHVWHYEPRFFGQRNFLRIQLTGSTVEPPLKVMVNASSPFGIVADNFSYDRRLN